MVTQVQKSYTPINREDVSLSDRDILKRYLGISDVPCKVSSPLRNDDDVPSFSFIEKEGTIFWKDFGTGNSGNLIGLLAQMWNVTYHEALLKIQLDSNSKIPQFDLVRTYKGKVHLTKGSTIRVRIREWKSWDVEFWQSFGITKGFATWCQVYPVSHAFFTRKDDSGKEQTICVPMDKYAYAYFEWKDGKESIKLYQPYSQTLKWLSKHDSSVWDLWKQAFWWANMKSDDSVILTSSRKDAMCLWQNLGIPAMSLQGEGYIPKPQVMKQVMDRFKKVYLWYDNDFKHVDDNPGQDNAKKLITQYPSLINVCIPSEFMSKDPSDLYKNHGLSYLKDIWQSVQ